MLMGRVAGVNKEKRILSIRTPGGAEREVRVSQDALIMRERRRSRFEEIERGDMVQLRFERLEDGTRTAVRIMSRSAPR